LEVWVGGPVGVRLGGLGRGVRPGPLAWASLPQRAPAGCPACPGMPLRGAGHRGIPGHASSPLGPAGAGQAEAGGPGWREARWDLWGWVWVRLWEEVWEEVRSGSGAGLVRVWCGSGAGPGDEVWTPFLRVGLGVCTPS